MPEQGFTADSLHWTTLAWLVGEKWVAKAVVFQSIKNLSVDRDDTLLT